MTLQETRWHPDVTVATVVVRDGRFLQVEESIGGRLLLNQPAGHLEPDESLLQAAVRETLEESGRIHRGAPAVEPARRASGAGRKPAA
ncbi:NUDIX domain-containing protein, partial [Xanthomonas campestris pv. campestris]|nr:NUDIX domain-containing protein [Xanthomonas campestris pv. campestris]MEB1504154.1 NUDIX domain-containing protein [Xanthomonas campestris pv. campestris]MEB1508467.1 NUDIX domain-containing protein [Xanthomonas campestris pv. campestris]MEB1536565.1 NUDIX domain-containing protein [Xanthomonas campestris pv. campestris]MEB1589794.1 NUDIX domain-containing protein [Xanthomonas campestris pv. campestris]